MKLPFCKDEIIERRKRLFSKTDCSSAIFFSSGAAGKPNPSFEYFSGCLADGCCLVLKRNGGLIFAHKMNYSLAKSNSIYPVKPFSSKPHQDIKKACGKGAVGFSSIELSAARYLYLLKNAKVRLSDLSEEVLRIRACKSGAEIAKISSAAKIAREILEGLSPWDFKTEKELSSHLKILAIESGCEAAFEPIVATGRNSAHPHHIASEKKLEGFVLVDFGVKKEGYCSDFTRCFFKGRKMKERRSYEKCIEIHDGIISELPNCKTGGEISLVGRELIRKKGFPRLIHSIGHGIGMEVHEYPRISIKSKDKLAGSVVSIEPAAYFSNFGVRYENMFAEINGKWKEI